MPRKTRKTPSPLGTVEKLPSGRWRAFYRHEGAKFTAPHTFTTKDEGHAWLATEHADRARGIWRDPHIGEQTLEDYARSYLGTRSDLAPRTHEDYRLLAERYLFAPVTNNKGRSITLGSVGLSEITPALVRSWYSAALEHLARKLATKTSTGRKLPARHPARDWAETHGLPIKPTGAVPPPILSAWKAAGAPVAPRRTIPGAKSTGNGTETVKRAYRVLRLLCNAARDDGLITENPCRVKGGANSHTAPRPIATPDEVNALAAAVPPRFAAAVIVAAWSALRSGEQFALARKHFDPITNTLTVERALLHLSGQAVQFTTPKTDKSRRKVVLPAFVAEVLKEHMAEFVADDREALIFATANGTPYCPSRVSLILNKARAAIGRPELHWHDLRHTGATLAYKAGAAVPEVQARLGHTTMRAANIYAHAAEDSDRILAERLNDMFAPTNTVVPDRRHLYPSDTPHYLQWATRRTN